MKPISTLPAILVAAFCFGHSDEIQKIKDQKDKESYSLGYQFGENMKFQGVDLDLEVYLSGIQDGLAGRNPQMTQDEIRATIAGLRQRLQAAQQKRRQEETEKNLAEGRAFLEENAKKPGLRTLPSGLQYKVLAEGSGKTPKKGESVMVHYRGTFINGTEFDSSYSRQRPPTFKVDGVIPGWTEALKMMKEGAKWLLFIPPNLAYGEKGNPPVIPPNSVLIFEIELISIQK